MAMILSGNRKILENMVHKSQRERCIQILYTPFLLLYNYDFGGIPSGNPKILENMLLMKIASRRGTVYTHSVYTVPVTI